jgi:hypothetical protein
MHKIYYFLVLFDFTSNFNFGSLRNLPMMTLDKHVHYARVKLLSKIYIT